MLNKKIFITTLLIVLSTPIQAASIGNYIGNAITRLTGNVPFYDTSDTYIINPNLPMLKEFEWATWRDSPGGRMAHDPAWFKTPNEKYLTKEVPFDWTKMKGKTALDKRNAYFNHLCKTEKIGFVYNEHPLNIKHLNFSSKTESTWFFPRHKAFPVKDMDKIFNVDNPYRENTNEWRVYKSDKEQLFSKIMKTAQQNPYINPDYGYYNWSENMTLKWDFRPVDDNFLKRFDPKDFPSIDTFREYLDDKGEIYRIRYSATEQKFLPVIKVDKPDAQYYRLYREIEREHMKKLGILGLETIDVELATGKILYYYKSFAVPAYLNSMHNSNFDIPINWKDIDVCEFEIKTIKNILN